MIHWWALATYVPVLAVGSLSKKSSLEPTARTTANRQSRPRQLIRGPVGWVLMSWVSSWLRHLDNCSINFSLSSCPGQDGRKEECWTASHLWNGNSFTGGSFFFLLLFQTSRHELIDESSLFYMAISSWALMKSYRQSTAINDSLAVRLMAVRTL